MTDLVDALAGNPYPGRVLILARTADAELSAVYALSGRSESSKRRRLGQVSADELRVLAVDDREHDSLRHYTAGHSDERWTVLGNGEQVSDVFRRLGDGMPPALALDDLSYEPDPPIFTPRITAVVDRQDGTAWLGAARRSLGTRETADITVLTVRGLEPGDAVLLSTYDSDGVDLRIAPAVRDVTTGARTGAELLDTAWAALLPQFRVAAALICPVDGVAAELRHA